MELTKLEIRKGIIFNQDGVPIGTLVDDDNPEYERIIELGSELIGVVENFIKQVNSGSFKPRGAVKEFERILEKHEI